MRFLPAGRVQNAMGAARQTTAYNCFVSGQVDDSMTALCQGNRAAETMREVVVSVMTSLVFALAVTAYDHWVCQWSC